MRQAMETDPPADDLAAEIGHRNEVAGLINDGGKASGEELNEDGGRHQGGGLAYQSQSQRVYTTQLDLEKGRDASAGTRRGNKNKQNKTSHPAGMILVLLMPMPSRLLLPLWMTSNSETATGVLQRKM